MAKQIKIDGQIVKIGDYVGFKADREQHGKLIKISGRELVIAVYDDYTCGTEKAYVDKDRCWAY